MITISISSYNQKEYLAEAIESCLRQSVQPDEIIVVDDGSTDGSLEVAKAYPVKVISQVNKGLSSARNTGIMNASSEYILFLDSDDVLLPNCIEKLEDTIRQTEADIVAPSFKCFGVASDEIILMQKPTLEDLWGGNRLGYFSAIKRAKLLEIGGYSPRMIWGYEDYHIWFNLLSRGATVTTIPDILVLYRTKQHSMIHDAQKHHEELMGQIKKDFGVIPSV